MRKEEDDSSSKFILTSSHRNKHSKVSACFFRCSENTFPVGNNTNSINTSFTGRYKSIRIY